MIGVPEEGMVRIGTYGVGDAGMGDVGEAKVVRITDDRLHHAEDVGTADVDALKQLFELKEVPEVFVGGEGGLRSEGVVGACRG